MLKIFYFRPIKERIFCPQKKAERLQKELGIPYYETSVFDQFGIKDVFDNAIRAALICEAALAVLEIPPEESPEALLQAPFLPPKSPHGHQSSRECPSTGQTAACLLDNPLCADVLFILQDQEQIFAHPNLPTLPPLPSFMIFF